MNDRAGLSPDGDGLRPTFSINPISDQTKDEVHMPNPKPKSTPTMLES